MDSVATIVGVVAALIIIGIGYMITKASEASEPVEAAVAVNGEGKNYAFFLDFFFGLFSCLFLSFFLLFTAFSCTVPASISRGQTAEVAAAQEKKKKKKKGNVGLARMRERHKKGQSTGGGATTALLVGLCQITFFSSFLLSFFLGGWGTPCVICLQVVALNPFAFVHHIGVNSYLFYSILMSPFFLNRRC